VTEVQQLGLTIHCKSKAFKRQAGAQAQSHSLEGFNAHYVTTLHYCTPPTCL
jgi:hypothetical protein